MVKKKKSEKSNVQKDCNNDIVVAEYDLFGTGRKNKIRLGRIDSIKGADWNCNSMRDVVDRSLEKSMQEVGYTDFIKVRWTKDGREIVDGHQRMRKLKEMGAKEVIYIDLGDISEEQAKKYTVIYNQTKGDFDPFGLAEIIKDVIDSRDLDMDISSIGLPYSPEEIDGILAILSRDKDLSNEVQSGRDGLDHVNLPKVTLSFNVSKEVAELWYRVKNKLGHIIEAKQIPSTEELYDARIFEFMCAETLNIPDESLEG